MEIQELADKISAWESDAGESFTDYFMHDNVEDIHWAFWLIGKGYQRGQDIFLKILAQEKRKITWCLDQELLYNIYQDPNVLYKHDENNNVIDVEICYDELTIDESYIAFDRDVLVWAEFLLSTPYYTQKVIEFLEEE